MIFQEVGNKNEVTAPANVSSGKHSPSPLGCDLPVTMSGTSNPPQEILLSAVFYIPGGGKSPFLPCGGKKWATLFYFVPFLCQFTLTSPACGRLKRKDVLSLGEILDQGKSAGQFPPQDAAEGGGTEEMMSEGSKVCALIKMLHDPNTSSRTFPENSGAKRVLSTINWENPTKLVLEVNITQPFAGAAPSAYNLPRERKHSYPPRTHFLLFLISLFS